MILGYNTNGFAHHRLDDALHILAELNYQGVALTPDVNHYDLSTPIKLDTLGLSFVIETGSRFLLDPKTQTPANFDRSRLGRASSSQVVF